MTCHLGLFDLQDFEGEEGGTVTSKGEKKESVKERLREWGGSGGRGGV